MVVLGVQNSCNVRVSLGFYVYPFVTGDGGA